MRLAPGTILRDKYRILRSVEEDGTGEVFEARHLELAGRYAVRVLCEGGIRDALQLDGMRREALVTSALTHPALARVYDLDCLRDGSPFVVMEFLSGRALGRLARESGPQPLQDVVALIEAIASPLAEAHRHGIIHGDLTPDSVFLLDAQADPRSRVKVLGFGFESIRAQAGRGGLNAEKAAPYQAPERRRGPLHDLDERADVYALGAIAYTLLAGRAPAPGALTAPAAVVAALSRAMSDAREPRFQTVTELARALRVAAASSPARTSGSVKRRAPTPAPVPVAHAETDRVRTPAGTQKIVAAAVGCGVAILVGVVAMPGLTKKAPAPKVAAAPTVAIAPKVAVAPPPPAATPPPPPPAPAPPAPARLPPSPRPVREGEVHHRRRSPHAGMSEVDLKEMKETYQKATRAFDLGNYDEAITAYKRTYELGGDAAMLYNIAQAARLGHKTDEAVFYYRRYLSRAPGASNRTDVQARIAELTGAEKSPAAATQDAPPTKAP